MASRKHEAADILASPSRTEYGAAEVLGVSVEMMRKWRQKGGGPKFVRLSGRLIRYPDVYLREFIEQRTHASTSEYCDQKQEGAA